MHDSLFEKRRDFVLSGLMITGIALLVIAASVQQGYVPLGGTSSNYLLGFGGAFFGIGTLGLFFRVRCSQ